MDSRVRDPRRAVALETTLLVHGLPRDAALPLNDDLARMVSSLGAEPALVGVLDGRPLAGVSPAELANILDRGPSVPKANSANLGVLCHWGATAATTVSATMEIAAAAGISFFATGGLGGVHRGYGCALDISADLAAFTRFPVAVVCSGVKSILDVAATRETLETLGVPVVGYRTDAFPAFYRREAEEAAGVDARFDDHRELARFVRDELTRTGRGIAIANPIPAEHELPAHDLERWIEQAEDAAEDASIAGRQITPFVLGQLHERSAGATLAANVELVRSNVRLAAQLAAD